ncbi:hypothetical protein Acsp01_53840 [Actinoplanes sp. NBRC 101535]|nr:hypothetical protein Acsp01_53840 [Actinoplanes sp. NBRC 101535]
MIAVLNVECGLARLRVVVVPAAAQPYRIGAPVDASDGHNTCGCRLMKIAPSFAEDPVVLGPAPAVAGEAEFHRFGETRLAGAVTTDDWGETRLGLQVQRGGGTYSTETRHTDPLQKDMPSLGVWCRLSRQLSRGFAQVIL